MKVVNPHWASKVAAHIQPNRSVSMHMTVYCFLVVNDGKLHIKLYIKRKGNYTSTDQL